MKRFLRFFGFPGKKKKRLLVSLWWLWTYRLALWLLPFSWIQDKSGVEKTGAISQRIIDWIEIEGIVESIDTAASFVPKSTCLTRALATQKLLRSRGQLSVLEIGVVKSADQVFSAHAWIEVDGRIVIGENPDHKRFTKLRVTRTV